MIFLNSTEANYRLDAYSEALIPEAAKKLIKKILVVDLNQRLTIDQVLEDSLFDSIKTLENPPPALTEFEKELKNHCQDFITRAGVYKLDGIEAFDKYFDENIKNTLKQKLEDMENLEFYEARLEHIIMLAKHYIFDIEPYPEDEAEL